MLSDLIHKWWPPQPDPVVWKPRLEAFYAGNEAYHAMTAAEDKQNHPQVQLLMSLIQPGATYAEFGCGGGEVCRAVGQTAHIHGFDISSLAVDRARTRCADVDADISVADATACPLPDESVDGVYSFEVHEHLWDPVAALSEMVRITRPGGLILISCPNRFSLDLHLPKRRLVRILELVLALTRYGTSFLSRRSFVNLEPDLETSEVYPDCDMITSLLPWNISSFAAKLQTELVFVDTYYMCAMNPAIKTDLAFQRHARHPILRWFGDHVLFLLRKRPGPL
jgi:SAM-dependent methyltransferase